MLQINFVIIFFLFIILLIDGIDEDLFDDLWKTLKPSISKNSKKQKFGENYAIKEEIVVKNEYHEQQNANKIMIKSENSSEKEMEDIKPKELQKIKNKLFEEENNKYFTKIKVPKIEMNKLNEESVENEFDQQVDQNVSLDCQSNLADDEDYNDRNKINEIKILMMKQLEQKREKTEENKETKMELIKKFIQLKKERIYGHKYDDKQRSKIECEIANELGTIRLKIYKWKRELKKEFDLINGFSTKQKIEKIEKFEKVKEEFINKFNLKTTKKIERKIATKLGVVWETIYRWKRKFGKSKIYSDVEKMEYVKRSEEMAERNPMISERKLAEKLDIDRMSLSRWMKKFSTKMTH